MSVTDREDAHSAEVARLQARVVELEDRLFEVEDWANRTVAACQERVYWLDRWHLDLNALMRRRGAAQLRAGLRTSRSLIRLVNRVKRRLLGQR